MDISLFNLTKNQINVIKGAAMSFLIFHNYLHWTNHIGENEADFDVNRVYAFINAIGADITMLPNAIATFLFHHSLLLFIFASGYGLAKKFIKNEPKSYISYIVPTLTKLYSLWIFGIVVCYILFSNLIPGERWYLEFSIRSLLTLNNLSFDTVYTHLFGPWWYFSLAVQLYIIFPLIFNLIQKYRETGFYLSLIASLILICILYPISNRYNYPLFASVFGHLPEIILGIGFAMFKQFRLNWKIVIPALLIFVLANFTEYVFPLGFLCMTILLLTALYPLYAKLPETTSVYKALLFLGSISMIMYVINGPLRGETLEQYRNMPPLRILWGAFCHYSITVVLAFILSLVYNPMMKKVINPLLSKFQK